MTTSEKTRNVFIGVDMQNDFVTGSLAVTDAAETIEPLNQVAEAVRATGGTTVFTRDWHPAATPHFDTWPVHCVADTEGAAFVEGLEISPNDIIISKGMGQTDGYSGFEGMSKDGQTLETIITPETPEQRVRVMIGGLATDYCVKSTALDLAATFADNPRVNAYLLRDAVRAVELEHGDEQAALDAMRDAKVTAISSADALKMIEEML